MADDTSPSKFDVLTKRQITHDEAKESLRRLINSHFGNEPKARVGIPARPDYDDDLIMSAYVEQQSALTAAPSAPAKSEHERWLDSSEWSNDAKIEAERLDAAPSAPAQEAVTRAREALKWYEDQMCEHGRTSDLCGKLEDGDCGGCRAHNALAALEPHP
jgi:hypothetical protein